MSPTVAQRVFLLFNLLAVLAVVYAVHDIVSVASKLIKQEPLIPLDTGISYLLLMSVFWILSLIQFIGLRNKQHFILKWSNQLVISWFIAALLLAYVIPLMLQQQLNRAGYMPCKDPQVVSRVSRGASLIFVHSQIVSEQSPQLAGRQEQVCEIVTSAKL